VQFELYERVALVGKAISHGTRLEILELLAQAEQSVEDLSRITETGTTSMSAHLQVLKRAGLVLTRRAGTRIYYRLASHEVAGLFVSMKQVASQLLPTVTANAGEEPLGVPLLHSVADAAGATILDVRPEREFAAGHFRGAISIPLAELPARVDELQDGNRVVIYCRGEFCALAVEAAALLRQLGIDAYALDQGVLEWRAAADIQLSTSASGRG
jgi:rhodanese-related sulfurtransferase